MAARTLVFPEDPRFAEKAGPILDLYAGVWEGKPLGPTDYVLSMDEKTSIQARGRSHEEMPPTSQTRRIEAEYSGTGRCIFGGVGRASRHRHGPLRGKTGIKPFGCWWIRCWSRSPTTRRSGCSSSWTMAPRIVAKRRWSGASADRRIVLVHTPVHASWLNQVEIYFSIIQGNVFTPNDFANLDAIRVRLALYEELSNRTPKPFKWKFTRQDMLEWLKRASPHFQAAAACRKKERPNHDVICETDH